MSALLKKSWRDLSRRRARTILTIITVALGVMGIGLFATTPVTDRAVEDELAVERMHNIGVRVAPVPLTAEQLQDLSQLDNVDRMSPQAALPVTLRIGDRRENAILVGIPDYDAQTVDVVRVTSGEVPRSAQVLTDQGNQTNAVISLVEGDTIAVEDTTGGAHELDVSGVGKNSMLGAATRAGTAVFYTNLDVIEQVGGWTGFTHLNFALDDTDPDAMGRTVEVIRGYLVANTSVVAFESLPDVREQGFWEGREVFSQYMAFISVLAFMILFVSLFLISNTMNTMVAEQTREIAMMKAIGATRATVFRSFLATSAMIGVVGSVIGASLGVLAAYVVSSTFMKTGFGFDVAFSVHWPTVGASLAVGVGVVALASLPALFRTLRISVVQGLGGPGIAADFGGGVLDRSLMGIRGLPRVAQMGIRNALRRRGRSVATALQVAFAVGVVIAMLNLGAGIYDATIGAYDHRTWDISTYLADSPADPMTVGRSSTIEEIAGVRSAEPVLFSSAEVSGRTVSLYGYVHDTQALDDLARLLDDGQGRWWTPQEAEASARVVVIGDALSKLEGIELGDGIELMTATGRHEFEVIGIDTSFMENGKFLYAPLETIQDVLQRGDSVNGFFINTTTNDHREIDAISLRISERLADLGYRADTTVNYVAAEQNVAQNQALSRLFLMVSFIVVLIVLVGLMSTLVMNILDRTKEIGMLRCIGARSKDVRRVFSSEGLFLASLGWMVGLPLGYAVYQLIVFGLTEGMKLTLPGRYDLIYVGWSLVFALAGTLIVIFFPLRRAAKMMPGDALRYE